VQVADFLVDEEGVALLARMLAKRWLHSDSIDVEVAARKRQKTFTSHTEKNVAQNTPHAMTCEQVWQLFDTRQESCSPGKN
jgi:hypothetical protein